MPRPRTTLRAGQALLAGGAVLALATGRPWLSCREAWSPTETEVTLLGVALLAAIVTTVHALRARDVLSGLATAVVVGLGVVVLSGNALGGQGAVAAGAVVGVVLAGTAPMRSRPVSTVAGMAVAGLVVLGLAASQSWVLGLTSSGPRRERLEDAFAFLPYVVLIALPLVLVLSWLPARRVPSRVVGVLAVTAMAMAAVAMAIRPRGPDAYAYAYVCAPDAGTAIAPVGFDPALWWPTSVLVTVLLTVIGLARRGDGPTVAVTVALATAVPSGLLSLAFGVPEFPVAMVGSSVMVLLGAVLLATSSHTEPASARAPTHLPVE